MWQDILYSLAGLCFFIMCALSYVLGRTIGKRNREKYKIKRYGKKKTHQKHSRLKKR